MGGWPRNLERLPSPSLARTHKRTDPTDPPFLPSSLAPDPPKLPFSSQPVCLGRGLVFFHQGRRDRGRSPKAPARAQASPRRGGRSGLRPRERVVGGRCGLLSHRSTSETTTTIVLYHTLTAPQGGVGSALPPLCRAEARAACTLHLASSTCSAPSPSSSRPPSPWP